MKAKVIETTVLITSEKSDKSKREMILNAAMYMINNHDYDYDSGSMDEFLEALGCDTNDMEFMDWFFVNIKKRLGYDDD